MKKTSKMLGAIALSAAMALGTAAPAFAESVSGVTDYSSDSGSYDGAYTDMYLEGLSDDVINNQITITVPLYLVMSVATNGGTLTCPSSDAYYIANRGTNTVEVAAIKPEAAAGVKLVSEAPTSIETNSTDASVYLTLQAGGSTTYTVGDGVDEDSGLQTLKSFTIAGNQTLGLNLAGSAYPSKSGDIKSFSTTDTTKAVTITYTVQTENYSASSTSGN